MFFAVCLALERCLFVEICYFLVLFIFIFGSPLMVATWRLVRGEDMSAYVGKSEA